MRRTRQDAQEVPRPVAEETAGPAHLGAEAPALAIDTDLEVRNLLVAGFSLGGVYDNEGLYHSGVAPYYSSDMRLLCTAQHRLPAHVFDR